MSTKRTPVKAAPAKTASAPRKQIALGDTPVSVSSVNTGKTLDPVEVKEEAQAAGDELVTAIVPKGFRLLLDDYREVVYAAGTCEMPRSHATHWYAESNGVTIYKPSKGE